MNQKLDVNFYALWEVFLHISPYQIFFFPKLALFLVYYSFIYLLFFRSEQLFPQAEKNVIYVLPRFYLQKIILHNRKERDRQMSFCCAVSCEIMDSVCGNRNLNRSHKTLCEFSHIMVWSVLWHLKCRNSHKNTCLKMVIGLQVKLEYEHSQGTILGVWNTTEVVRK